VFTTSDFPVILDGIFTTIDKVSLNDRSSYSLFCNHDSWRLTGVKIVVIVDVCVGHESDHWRV
jgi:hypothetical protein